MNPLRKIEHNKLKREWQEYNKGIAKRYRTPFRKFWKLYRREKL